MHGTVPSDFENGFNANGPIYYGSMKNVKTQEEGAQDPTNIWYYRADPKYTTFNPTETWK